MSCVAAGGWRGSRRAREERIPLPEKHTDTNVAVIIDIPPSLILADRGVEECKIHWSQRGGKNVFGGTIWLRYRALSKTQLKLKRLLRRRVLRASGATLLIWDKGNHWLLSFLTGCRLSAMQKFCLRAPHQSPISCFCDDGAPLVKGRWPRGGSSFNVLVFYEQTAAITRVRRGGLHFASEYAGAHDT